MVGRRLCGCHQLAPRGAHAEGIALAERPAAVMAKLGADNVHLRSALTAKANLEDLAGVTDAARATRARLQARPPAER